MSIIFMKPLGTNSKYYHAERLSFEVVFVRDDHSESPMMGTLSLDSDCKIAILSMTPTEVLGRPGIFPLKDRDRQPSEIYKSTLFSILGKSSCR
jgi:hypothetical protein